MVRQTKSPQILGLTMGEPAGIAPDITIAAWRKLQGGDDKFFLIGDERIISARAESIGIECPVEVIDAPAAASQIFATALPVLREPFASAVTPGALDPANAEAVLSSIRRAAEFACNDDVAAMVTNPIHKSVLYGAGFAHRGHTDFIADLARQHGYSAEPVMMLISGNLRAVPLTVHIPLRDVAGSLTQAVIVDQTRVIAHDLQRLFGISRPRIAMTGLNPHAGESASMGLEERDIIAPAIKVLTDAGIAVTGPLPADTVFYDEARANFDAIVCMYHDQALIPVKTIGFYDGVNTTLGLPFVRTSPDHGTALTLAGTGRANPSSLIAAIGLAGEMARQRRTSA